MSILHDGQIPKIFGELRLSEYAPELALEVLHIWLNPPKDTRMHFDLFNAEVNAVLTETIKLPATSDDPAIQAQKDALKARLEKALQDRDGWLAEIWSQGAEGTQVKAEEVTKLRVTTAEDNPLLYAWLARKTLAMMASYRNDLKKV